MMEWKKVRLDTVAEIIAGQSPESQYYNKDGKGVAFFQGKADFGDDYPTVRYYCTVPTKMARPFDILMSVRAPVGPTNICNQIACIGRGLAAIRCKEKLDYKYLYFFLKNIEKKLAAMGNGTTFSAITTAVVKAIEIPLPTLEKQQQIAHILDKADALRRKDRELLQQYDALAQAIFIEMFGDPVRNERGWKVGTIREMASEVKYGTSSPAESQGDYVYLRMNNITYSGEWDFKDLKYISVSSENKPKYVLKKHDLVFNRTNSKELVGKTAVYDREEEMIIAGYLIRVRTNAYGNPYYISGFLNSKIGKSILFNMCKSIIGMANINAQELQNIQLQIPPIELQNEYQIRIEAIKGLKQNVLAAQEQSETLFQSLLQGAFSGSLVIP
jgi:type I restriction enzyme S subunit